MKEISIQIIILPSTCINSMKVATKMSCKIMEFILFKVFFIFFPVFLTLNYLKKVVLISQKYLSYFLHSRNQMEDFEEWMRILNCSMHIFNISYVFTIRMMDYNKHFRYKYLIWWYITISVLFDLGFLKIDHFMLKAFWQCTSIEIRIV